MVSSPPSWHPKTESDKEAVLEQLDRLLGFAAFRRSSRYPKLLRYLVERGIENHPEHLKERTIGIEVFGRQPDYDTNEDPIVRVTAGEVRKRLAQYYHESGHENELRVELLQFSYVPVFQWTQSESFSTSISPASTHSNEWVDASSAPRRHWKSALLWSVSILAAGALCLGWIRGWGPRSATEAFWKPILASKSGVILAVGTPEFGTISLKPSPPAVSQRTQDARHVAFPDVYSVSLLVGFLGNQNKPLDVKDSSTLSFTDLQSGPAVMVGGFNNPWTLRATNNLRFHFALHPLRALIVDSRNPAAENWFVDRGLSISERTQDYGIVARFTNPETNQPTIVAAGIGGSGTVVASEFLTDPQYSSLLYRESGGKNVEVVLATQVIGGKPGPPRIIATETW